MSVLRAKTGATPVRWPSLRSEETGSDRMKDFAGRIAVVTGGGTGMGRELVR